MKLFHIILLSSAVAGSVLDAGAEAERLALSPAVLGPHFAEAVEEALELGHYRYGTNTDYLIMCRDGHYHPYNCYNHIMSMLLNGTDAVRYVTRECGTICREFPDYHCLDNCKRVQLGEVHDGDVAYSLHLLRKMLGMRKMTMLERWGLGFLQNALHWFAGAFFVYLLAGALYYTHEDMAHAGTPETVRSGLLWGSIICSFFGSVFVGLAIHKLLKNVAGEGELSGAY